MSRLHSLGTTRRSASLRRGRAGLAAAAILAIVTPLATACGAGFDSAALDVKPNAGAATVGSVKINNVWVIVDPSTGNAEVIGAVANDGSTDVNWPTVQIGGNAAQFQAPAGNAVASGTTTQSGIGAGQSVSFGLPGQPQLQLTGSSLAPGNLTHVTFDFGSLGNVNITAQIESNTGLWADYNPDGPLSASGDNGASASDTASPSPSAS